MKVAFEDGGKSLVIDEKDTTDFYLSIADGSLVLKVKYDKRPDWEEVED